MNQEKRGRGGDVKRAPEGFYTAAEAIKRLGLNRQTFFYYVKNGKINRHIPPMRKEGFYSKKEIDQMAAEIALYFHTHAEEEPETQTRAALPEDAQGIYDVLASFGWNTAPVALRLKWYKVNPFIDYVVLAEGNVMGYITAVPYKPDAMEAMMSGRKRAWDIKPEDIYPYRKGTYDLYVGIAARQDIPKHTLYASRLISGFLTFLEELAAQEIIIRRLYAVSAEKSGQRLGKALGFEEQEPEPGDLFPRFILDLETSGSHFAKLYRKMAERKVQ